MAVKLADTSHWRADGQNALLVSQMNWEQENALLYAGRHEHEDVAWLRLFDVFPHFPYLVRDNLGIEREVVLTADAAAPSSRPTGLFPYRAGRPPGSLSALVTAQDPAGDTVPADRARPPAGLPADAEDSIGLSAFSPATDADEQAAAYEVVAGVAGERPALLSVVAATVPRASPCWAIGSRSGWMRGCPRIRFAGAASATCSGGASPCCSSSAA